MAGPRNSDCLFLVTNFHCLPITLPLSLHLILSLSSLELWWLASYTIRSDTLLSTICFSEEYGIFIDLWNTAWKDHKADIGVKMTALEGWPNLIPSPHTADALGLLYCIIQVLTYLYRASLLQGSKHTADSILCFNIFTTSSTARIQH